ncbi:MAG: rubrerythrin family protein [Deltaproteobacteria bacterium]|nr:rubrerythrin family protein [Deltaproteobacteria bacterium]
MSRTTENLKTAFAGESQANRKYLAYAERAAADGMPNVAKLFRAAADAETVHALRHWRALGMIRDTVQNLEDALAGETYEVDQMYPPMLAQAQADQEISAQHAFRGALEAERVHVALYSKALNSVRSGQDIEEFRAWTCPVCGYTHAGGEIDKCPVCGVAFSKFREVL